MQDIETEKYISSNTENFLINAIFLLNLFPFFRFIPFIQAEVQPVGAVLAAGYLLLFSSKKHKRLYKFIFPYTSVLVLYFLASIFLVQYGELEFIDVVQSLLIFVTPLLTFIALCGRLDLISISIYRAAIYTWFLICFLQFYFSSLLNASGITFLLSSVLSRFSAEKLEEWNRGVVGLSPEPSYGAHIILLMFVFGVFLHRQNRIGNLDLAIISVLSLFMVYANQSATMGFVAFVFIAAYALFELIGGTRHSRGWLIFAFVSLVPLFVLLISYFPEISKIRLFEVLFDLGSNVLGKDSQSFDVVDFTNSYGSVRTTSVKVGYSNALLTYGIGSGMGGWGTHFLDSLEQGGIDVASVSFFKTVRQVSNLKPYAYSALVAFDLGLVGLVSLSYFFLKLLIQKLNCSCKSSFAWACFVCFILGVYFNSPTSLPTYWLFFLLFLNDEEQPVRCT